MPGQLGKVFAPPARPSAIGFCAQLDRCGLRTRAWLEGSGARHHRKWSACAFSNMLAARADREVTRAAGSRGRRRWHGITPPAPVAVAQLALFYWGQPAAVRHVWIALEQRYQLKGAL